MSRYTKQVKPKQNKSFKSKPVSEGGLGLSPRTGSGSIDSDIQKAKENKLAKYWYDKYTDLVKEVAYERKLDRQNLNELDEKMKDMNEGLLTEIATKTDSDALAPLDQKFVTFDKLAEHYKVFIGRIQEQIATIGGGGIGDVVADPSPQLGGNLVLNSKDITGTGNITHTGNITTTGNNSISGTLGVTGVTTFEEDVIFTGANTNMRWDNSTSDLKLFDNTRLEFGSNKDFEIWHGGSHTFMKNSGGDLRIRGDVIKLAREDSSERYIECNVNNAVQIFHNGTETLTTTSSGISVTGNVVISDGGTIGSSSDTDSITIDSSGNITASQNLTVTGETTHNDDVSFPGQLYNILWDKATSKFKFDDNAQLVFGSASGGDMKLFHQSGNSSIRNETGQFRIAGNDIRIQTQNHSEDYIICTDGGAVQIFHNDSEKLTTTSTGVTVTGDAKVGTGNSTGVILTSPDGTEYRLIVANGGALSTSAV